jgi:hypothetical protein
MNATTSSTPEQMNWADYVDALAASAFEARFKRYPSAESSASRSGDSARLEMPRPPKAKPDVVDTKQS